MSGKVAKYSRKVAKKTFERLQEQAINSAIQSLSAWPLVARVRFAWRIVIGKPKKVSLSK